MCSLALSGSVIGWLSVSRVSYVSCLFDSIFFRIFQNLFMSVLPLCVMLSIDFSIASWFACSIASLCLFWLAMYRFFVLSISVGLLLIIAFEYSFFSITFLSFASLTFLLLFFFTLPAVIVYLPMVFIRHFFIIVVSVPMLVISVFSSCCWSSWLYCSHCASVPFLHFLHVSFFVLVLGLGSLLLCCDWLGFFL